MRFWACHLNYINPLLFPQPTVVKNKQMIRDINIKINNEKSIALIVCYFGKLPWYFNYFAHSCKYNPTIDFFIITDETIDIKSLPNNVKHIYKTLNDINLLATEKLGFEINLTYAYPYKVAEFKPAYGLIFSELLAGYDFLGTY